MYRNGTNVPDPGKLVHSFERGCVPKLLERSDASSRYKANSRYVSIEAYPFALPCGERIEGERIDACSRAVSDCWYSPDFRTEKNGGGGFSRKLSCTALVPCPLRP